MEFDVDLFVIARWMVFLGVWIEASKILFETMVLRRHGSGWGKALLRPFRIAPERVFVLGILAYYANFMISGEAAVTPVRDDVLVINFAYAGYWLLRAVPFFRPAVSHGSRSSDVVFTPDPTLGQQTRPCRKEHRANPGPT